MGNAETVPRGDVVKIARIQRLLRLLVLLQTGRPFGVADLMKELGVSRRTLFRDLEVVTRAGIPCFYDDQTRSYRIDRAFFLPPVHFTLSEALALLLASRRFVARQVLPDHEAATRAAVKVESLLPTPLRAQCGSFLDSVEVRWTPTAHADAITRAFDTCQRAIYDRRKLRIAYDSYYEQREIHTLLHPYKVAFISRAWYAIGFSELHEAVRTFKLDRVLSAEPLDESYEAPENFDLSDYFGNAWQMIRGDKTYHVRIRFSPKVAGNVEEVLWHPTQQTQRDEKSRLVFEVDVDGIDEMSWWVLGYGQEAIVEQPPELRELICQHAQALVKHYAS